MNPLLGILLLFILDANAAAQVEECDQEKSRQEVQRLTAAGAQEKFCAVISRLYESGSLGGVRQIARVP